MLQTIQPAQLPELQMFNPMAPLQAYYQGKNDAMQMRQQEQQMRMNDMNMKVQQMRLDEYEQDAPYRQQEKELSRVKQIMETDQQMIQFGRQMLTGLDPEAEDFDQQAANSAVEMERYLVERAKVRPETAEMVIGNAIKAGVFSRESVMREQIKQGLREAPGKEEKPELDKSSGQQFIRNPETGLYEAVPVSGFVKETTKSNGTPSQLAKLIEERNALPANSQDRAIYDQAIIKESTRSGESIEVGPDGTVRISRGETGGSGLGRQAENQVQKGMIDASNALVRLSDISKKFNEGARDYLTAQGKAKLAAIDIKLKTNVSTTEEEKKYVEDATSFITASFNNLNRTLNELSGAAITAQEAVRLKQNLPDPGEKGFTKLLAGDNVVEFETKLKDSIKMQQMAIARFNYINNNGMTIGKNNKGEITGFFDDNGNKISLDDIPVIMKKRASEIAEEIKTNNQNIGQVELGPIIKQAIAAEFGLTVQ